MAAFFYCKSCGGKTVSDASPHYCSKCGNPFYSKNVPPVLANKAKTKKIDPPVEEDSPADEDSTTDVTEMPDLNKITYDIDFGEVKGVTLAEVNAGNVDNKKRKKPVKNAPARSRGAEVVKSKEEIIKSFQKAAGNDQTPISID